MSDSTIASPRSLNASQIAALILILGFAIGTPHIISTACRPNAFSDFDMHYGLAMSVVHGEPAFSRDPPDSVAFPAQGTLYAPFALFPNAIAHWLFAAALFASVCAILYITLNDSVFLDGKPAPQIARALGAAIILNSQSVIETTRLGQTSVFIALLVLLVLFRPKSNWGPVWLACAMAIKTTFGLLALPLISSRRLRTCALAFVGFVLLALSPALFGGDLRVDYTDYVARVRQSQLPGGINDPMMHGENIIETIVFNASWLNASLRLLIVGSLAWVAVRDFRARQKLSINLLLLAAAASQAVVYHRKYDALIVLPLLVLASVGLYRRGHRIEALAASVFLLFFVIPEQFVLKAGSIIGSWNHLGLITSTYAGFSNVLPINAVVMTLLALFAGWVACARAPMELEFRP